MTDQYKPKGPEAPQDDECDRIEERGVLAVHTSEPEGSWPDVGLSLGLGGAHLWIGEIPGPDRLGWYVTISAGNETVLLGRAIYSEGDDDFYDKMHAPLTGIAAALDAQERVKELEGALDTAIEAIESLEPEALGVAPDAYTGDPSHPIRDEVLYRLRQARALKSGEGSR